MKPEEHEQEEWGGWKFVAEMLGNPDGLGIYQTSKCYKQLYDFVVAQKKKAYDSGVEQELFRERENFDHIITQAKDSATHSLIEEAKKRLEGEKKTYIVAREDSADSGQFDIAYDQGSDYGFNAGLSRASEVLDNLKQQV